MTAEADVWSALSFSPLWFPQKKNFEEFTKMEKKYMVNFSGHENGQFSTEKTMWTARIYTEEKKLTGSIATAVHLSVL